MNCPACGRVLGGGEQRCNACGSMVVPPLEGALAPDPSGIPVSSRGKVEPLREIPGLRKKERTWKDEVRDRVRDRHRRRGNEGELPLFREPEEAASKQASLDAEPVAEPPQAEAAPLDDVAVPPGNEQSASRIHFGAEVAGGRDRARPQGQAARDAGFTPAERAGVQGGTAQSPLLNEAASERDSLTRASNEKQPAAEIVPTGNKQSASRIHFGEREGGSRGTRHSGPLLNDELPLDLEMRPAEAPTLDEPVIAVAAEAPEPEPDRIDNEEEWLLEPVRPREAERRLERPATLLDRVKAAAIDLALLSVLWAVVVYFAGRTARVSLWGLLPGAAYLLGFLALLGLVYAGYFTGTTGQTLGKIVCRLRVVDAAGRPPGCLRAFFRSALADIGIALACAAMLPVFFDPARRALHDRIFRTRVVRF